jgi:hypothetical protein
MKFFSTVMTVLVLILVSQAAVFGQDFEALLQAVERLEANLKQLVDQEPQARIQDTARLEAANEKLSAEDAGPVDLTALRSEIAEIKAAIAGLQHNQGESAISENDVTELTYQLASLQAELDEFRQDFQTSPQLASVDATVGPTSEPRGWFDPSALEEASGLQISGFFDVVGRHQSSADDKTEFGLGQAEVDLESELPDRAAVAVAIAYNADEALFELGAAELGINVYGSEESLVTSLDVTGGQFDVPFGIDYHVYRSIERKLVTAPLVVDLTHGGWNDAGLRLNLESAYGNLVCYWVNGFESSVEVLDEVQTLATGEDVYEEVDTSPANAIGTRLGITPLGWMGFGGSFAAGWNASGKSEMSLVGLDLQLNMFNLELKGEFIAHSLNRTIAEENNRGYYVQGLYHVLDRAFVVGRYGSFKPDQQNWHGQGSIGFGYALTDGVELRWESLISETSEDNQNIVQLVAGF